MGLFAKIREAYWEGYRNANGVVRNMDKIDIMAAKKAGGTDLLIVTDQHCLDASAKTQKLLREKVENYLSYINSEDFKMKFPDAIKENTHIIIIMDAEPDPLLLEFIWNMVPWAQENNASLKLKIKIKGNTREVF